MLSILELVELVFLLLEKKDNTTELVTDEKGDKKLKQERYDTELSEFDQRGQDHKRSHIDSESRDNYCLLFV